LITRVLNLHHLKAVLGVSMGGMQVFHWMIAHPDFMDKAISIVGSPRSQPDDQRRWQAYVETVNANPAWKRALLALARASPLAAVNELSVNPADHTRQAQAVMALDIFTAFGGSMERAAATIRASLLVVGTRGDREVNPEPAFEFGPLAHAEVLELDGRCGHQAPSCEQTTLWPAIARFLAR
jgi:homoserine O-acetyltransferase